MPRTWRPPSPDQECAKRVRGFVYAALGPAQVAIRAHGTLGADYARRLRSVARELPRGSTEPPVTQAIGNDRSWPKNEPASREGAPGEGQVNLGLSGVG
jgi:hypothetical protein